MLCYVMQENANNAKHYLENHENEPNKMTSYYHRILLYSYILNKKSEKLRDLSKLLISDVITRS